MFKSVIVKFQQNTSKGNFMILKMFLNNFIIDETNVYVFYSIFLGNTIIDIIIKIKNTKYIPYTSFPIP